MRTGATRTLVSILTPSYNQAEWLADNLKSVANQTYPEIEHIVMDGGSDDGSVALLEDATPPVIWRSEPDRGQSDALNKAFAASSGEIIGWLNSDDAYVDRRAVAAAVDLFHRYPDIGVVYGHALAVNSSNQMLHVFWAPPRARWWIDLRTPFLQPAVFFRRSVIEPPLVDEQLHYVMDRDLWLRLSRKTAFKRINLVVALDRLQPQRKTLSGDHHQELVAYERKRGHHHDALGRRLARISMGIGLRLIGSAVAISAPRSIDPAIDLDFGTVSSRVRWQVMTRRRHMPFR